MVINTSPDISNLNINVNWDISGTTPQIILTNESTGNNLAGISWAFVAISPSGTYIHNGSIANPDVVGVWSTFTLNDAWPKPFNQLEWSGAPYTFFVIIQDSIGNVITSIPQTTPICRPVGNTQYSKNTYGLASSNVNVQCSQASVYFQDTTYATYLGQQGTQISSVLQVMYPIDETGNIPPQFIIGQYSTALVPISYSSSDYQFLQYSVYNYPNTNNTSVTVKYLLLKRFAVWCNVDLLPLVCEIDKLADAIESGNCSDVNEAQRKLNLITPKLMLIVMTIQQPLIGVDVPKLIKEIEFIGGFQCNCCGAPTGIIPTTASIIGGYNFLVNKLGGDVNGNFSTTGNNITLNIGDRSYVVAIGQESPQAVTAFSFTPVVSGGGFTKTYYLNIDGQQLGIDVLNNIAADQTSLNLFAQLVQQTVSASNLTFIVDGGCIFQTTASCDYDFTLHNIPASTTHALLTSISINNVAVPLSFPFNQTNLPALNSYINGLGYGTCAVTNLGSGNVLIAFDNNTNNLTGLTYRITSGFQTSYQADFARNCTGYVPVSANEVVQNIIDYICGITDAEVVTSQSYTISYIDNTGALQETVINGGEPLSTLISNWITDNLSTINYVLSIGKLNCTNIISNFPQTSQIMQSNDFVLGTKNGSCARIYPVELGTDILNLGIYDADWLAAFCTAVNLCRGNKPCTAFSVFNLAVVDHSPADNEMNIVVTYTNPDSAFTGVDIYQARIDNTNTPVYVYVNTETPGASPYTISNLPIGQYAIQLVPRFSDGRSCLPVTNTTAPCTGINAFNAVLTGGNIVVTYSATSPQVLVNITYPNGGSFSQIYTNGASISVTPPSGVYGNYTVTMQSVCDATTGFFGASTAPAIVSIPQPTGSVTATAGSSLTAGFYVANVGGIPLFALNNNLVAPNTQIGIHTAMTAQPISFSVVNPSASNYLNNGVDIYVNASFVTRVQFSTGTGVYSSSNISAAATDAILLNFNNNT